MVRTRYMAQVSNGILPGRFTTWKKRAFTHLKRRKSAARGEKANHHLDFAGVAPSVKFPSRHFIGGGGYRLLLYRPRAYIHRVPGDADCQLTSARGSPHRKIVGTEEIPRRSRAFPEGSVYLPQQPRGLAALVPHLKANVRGYAYTISRPCLKLKLPFLASDDDDSLRSLAVASIIDTSGRFTRRRSA